ncbi:hypothetical protein [Parageobacillus thermantarcticus]|nr:hypothetical protein [Parageobacillus thermantarcticus]
MKKYSLIMIVIIFLLIGCSMEKRKENSPKNEQQTNYNSNMEINQFD